MKETEQLRKLMESIDNPRSLNESFSEGDVVEVIDPRAFAAYFSEPDWVERLAGDNEFTVMDDGDPGMIWVDHNGDEMEAPAKMFRPYSGENQGFDPDNRGMMRGMGPR